MDRFYIKALIAILVFTFLLSVLIVAIAGGTVWMIPSAWLLITAFYFFVGMIMVLVVRVLELWDTKGLNADV